MSAEKPVYSYSAAIDVPFPEEHKRPARIAVNDAHGYTWTLEGDAPKSVKDAHWLLNAGQLTRVTVNVYADGTRALVAAEPPDPGPSRPDDMAELARLVATELQRVNVCATNADFGEAVVETVRVCQSDKYRTKIRYYNMHAPDFDNLTPRECADLIQRQEAAKAAKWAGDK